MLRRDEGVLVTQPDAGFGPDLAEVFGLDQIFRWLMGLVFGN